LGTFSLFVFLLLDFQFFLDFYEFESVPVNPRAFPRPKFVAEASFFYKKTSWQISHQRHKKLGRFLQQKNIFAVFETA
jgi:hypothetical protein